MASHSSSDYEHGKMDITEQSNTFSAFITLSVWGALLVIYGVLTAVLHYGYDYKVLLAVFVSTIVCAIGGVLTKINVSFYITLGVLFFFGIIASLFGV